MENLDEILSFDPEVSLKTGGKNEASVCPSSDGLCIPTVELDRKAVGAMVWGILSLIFFPIFPFAIAAIVKGCKNFRAPKRSGSAKAGIVMGILSLLLFCGAVFCAVWFFDVWINSDFIREAIEWVR